MKQAIKIFLSYAKEDIDIVSKFYRRLKEKGYEPWLDIKNLLPGQRWEQEIPKAIKTSDFILVFISKTSISKRGYVQKEFKLTLEVLDTIPEDQIFVIPIRLDACAIPERFQSLQYCDLFEPDGFEKIMRALRKGMNRIDSEGILTEPVHLRATPLNDLSVEEVRKMLQQKNLFENARNSGAKGIIHHYVQNEIDNVTLIVDYTTGLTWQQSGSDNRLKHPEAQEYIVSLNTLIYGGHNDWRLPTLEEAMSLMAPKSDSGSYIDSIFNLKQDLIWTADQESDFDVWLVFYGFGDCDTDSIRSRCYVRAVRSE